MAAAFCYALGFIYFERSISPRALPAHDVAFSHVLAGAVIMLALTPWVAAPPPRPDPTVITAMGVLGCAGTGLAYIWHCNLVAAWGSVRTASVTYAMPVVGMLLGALILNEAVRWHQILGTGMVIAGWSVINTYRPHTRVAGGRAVRHGQG
ncbi:DMT family transporter [Streptomyces sp. NPDC002730]|uniref:DMT family transporter n=1 Tax=Streptomyces sp. NPDC002730 TaxID=3364662 RepID=UPI003673D9E4